MLSSQANVWSCAQVQRTLAGLNSRREEASDPGLDSPSTHFYQSI